MTRLDERVRRQDTFRITVLCTGNRFRSPIAAATIQSLTHDLPIQVQSLGTRHVGRVGALPVAIAAAAGLGLDLTTHVARSIAADDLESADLVLGFELTHLAQAAQLGAPVRRSFTLPEFTAALDLLSPPDASDPVTRARAIVEAAHAERPARPWPPREIPDPAGVRRERAFEIAWQVQSQASAAVRGLFGAAAARAVAERL